MNKLITRTFEKLEGTDLYYLSSLYYFYHLVLRVLLVFARNEITNLDGLQLSISVEPALNESCLRQFARFFLDQIRDKIARQLISQRIQNLDGFFR